MSELRLEVSDGVAVVTMDNPPVNAMDREWDMIGVFDSFADRDDVRAAVLTGAGARAFCAGADVKRSARDAAASPPPGARLATSRAARERYNAIAECATPVIGAINGHALGAGMALAASCDFLIASEHATFGLPEIDVGLLGGASHMLRVFPHGWTRWAALTGQRIGARDALAAGAVLRVVPAGELMDAAVAEARVIASKMPLGVRMAKSTLNLIEEMDVKNGYRYEQTQTAILARTEDALEAKRAFAEKRQPAWRGR